VRSFRTKSNKSSNDAKPKSIVEAKKEWIRLKTRGRRQTS
jgi:hypothetical protein